MKKLLTLALLVMAISHTIAQTIPAYVDTNDLLGWYPFNANANNEYGTGKNGVVLGPIPATDRFGTANSAYHFNGLYDHILIDTTFLNVGWSDITISWWMKNDTIDNPNNANNNQLPFITIPHNGLSFTYNWQHNNKYMLLAGSNPPATTWDILNGVLSNTNATDHVWNHFVIRKQGGINYSFFVNGVLDSTYTGTTLANNYYCRMIFGNIDSIYGMEGVWGSLDDYGIWKRALSDCEIKKLYLASTHVYITAQPVDVLATIAPTSIIHFSITDGGTGNTYQWQLNDGSGFTNISASSVYSGITSPILTITGITTTMNNYEYRCVATGTSGCVDTSDYGKLTAGALAVNSVAKQEILVSPNPTTGDVFITSSDNVTIKVYDITGRSVIYVAYKNKISIADQPSGVYLIKIYDDKGALVYNEKIIKQ